MRVKVTTEIDINLKLMFEATKGQHGKTYKEVLEAGISALLTQYDPVSELQARIELKENELAEARQELARMRILQPQQKRMIEYEVKIQRARRRSRTGSRDLHPAHFVLSSRGLRTGSVSPLSWVQPHPGRLRNGSWK